jgi:hypothetical protein
MNLTPTSVFGTARPTPVNVNAIGGYKYQPGTIIATARPQATVPTFGTAFSPPAVPSIGSLWGATPPTASGNAYTPNLPTNTGAIGITTTKGIPTATNTGGSGFFSSLNAALFG